MPIRSVNPATGQVLATFEELSAAETAERVGAATVAFRAWRRTSFDERAIILRRAAEILEAEKRQFARLMTLEMGKTLRSAVGEVEKSALGCRYYAEHAAQILADKAMDAESRARLYYLPIGPILAVMPWNFPFWQVFRFLAPALMAGNTALLKHASNVPQCALAIEQIMRRAGLSDGVFQTLLVGSDQVEAIVRDHRVAAVTLTGSETAGQAVARAAGSALKKCVLELGGNDPFIVLPSANLDEAIKVGVTARIMNNGQSCICAKRFIVHRKVYSEFVDRFVAQLRALKVGDPMAPDVDLGPLATHDGMESLARQVDQSVKAGAELVVGGHRIEGPGNYFAPAVLIQVPRAAPAYSEELFGPVAVLFEAQDLDHALDLANDTPFGLGSSVWTNVASEQERCARELEAGQTFVNAMTASDPRLPFGGIKRSGFGRELGALGPREFTNIKTVVTAHAPN